MSMPPPPPGNMPPPPGGTPPPPGNMPPPPMGGMPMAGGGPASTAGLASWPERVVATLLDGVIVAIPMIALWIVALILGALADVLAVLMFLVIFVYAAGIGFYLYYLNGSKGQTPGKMVMGLKVVSEETGQLIGGGAGIARGFLHILDGFCLIGYLFPLWDAKRQTFADKVMKTVVTTGNPKSDFAAALKSILPVR